MTTIAPPETWETTAVIARKAVGDPYTGERRHDETIETWKYAVVYGGGFAIWLILLIVGWYAMTHGWR